MSEENAQGPSQASIGELVAKVTAQFSALVRDEIKHAEVETKAKVTKLGMGGGILAAAGVLALYMFGVLLTAAGFGVGQLVNSVWLGFLIVGGVLLLLVLLLALIGVGRLKASKKHTIDPKGGLAKDVAALKKGITK